MKLAQPRRRKAAAAASTFSAFQLYLNKIWVMSTDLSVNAYQGV